MDRIDTGRISLVVVMACVVLGTAVSGDMDRDTAEKYFEQFQYMGANNPNPQIANLVNSDPEQAYVQAIRMFQEHWNLQVTGELDTPTRDLMSTPRCGMPDMMTMEDLPTNMMMNHTRKRRYTLFGDKWPTNDVTYKFLNFPQDYDLTADEIRSETDRAFKVWQAVSPLRFRLVGDRERANINIRFVRYHHGDGGAFDGRGGTLAHAYSPTLGDTHFDDDEIWTLGSHEGTNYFQVAAHEFGHALGLGHSEHYSALMAPFYTGYQPSFSLHSDDILAIQSRYGPPTDGSDRPITTAPPRPQPTTRPRPTAPPTQYPSKPSICQDMTLDAITINLENGEEVVYAFRGDEYAKIDNRGYGIMMGYPKKIRNGWQGLPDNLDAALYLDPVMDHRWEWDGERWQWIWVTEVIRDAHTYFFQGGLVYLFINSRPMAGYPKEISDEFSGLPRRASVDAAFVWNGNGHVYFIIDNYYYRYDVNTQRVDYGYPQPLYYWEGLPTHIDAAIRHTNKWTYVFSGDEYYRISDSRMAIASDYPRNIDSFWLRCDKFRNVIEVDIPGDGGDPSLAAASQGTLLTVLVAAIVASLARS